MCRKEGQQTQEEVQKRNLRDELEERERKHFSSKDKSYVGNASGSIDTKYKICRHTLVKGNGFFITSYI